MPLDNLSRYLNNFLEEDRVAQDITTEALIPPKVLIRAQITAKEKGICCGISLAAMVLKKIDKRIKFRYLKRDGMPVKNGQCLAKIFGPAQGILKGERLALNLLSHLSGIATITHQFVRKSKGCRAKIFDTRKTTPGLRLLEKYAVRCGGGYNHRMDLSDGVLIKDNHIYIHSFHKNKQALHSLVRWVRSKTKGQEIAIEVDNLKQLKDALAGSPDIILLDNMNTGRIRESVKIRNRLNKKVLLEVSGNVSLNNVRQIASTGVDRISIGSLTHSSKSIDLSLEIVEVVS